MKKMVIKVTMNGEKPRSRFSKMVLSAVKQMFPCKFLWRKFENSATENRKKAMKIAVTFPGVVFVGLQGEEKEELVVKGDGIDATELTDSIRKNVACAQIISMGEEDEKK